MINKKDKGRKGYLFGIYAEIIACIILLLKGYRISTWRYKTHVGEIDLIAAKKNIIVFVEVKFRSNKENSLNAITAKNKSRIINAANIYISKSDDNCIKKEYRFDAIIFYPPCCFVHIKNAWQI